MWKTGAALFNACSLSIDSPWISTGCQQQSPQRPRENAILQCAICHLSPSQNYTFEILSDIYSVFDWALGSQSGTIWTVSKGEITANLAANELKVKLKNKVSESIFHPPQRETAGLSKSKINNKAAEYIFLNVFWLGCVRSPDLSS